MANPITFDLEDTDPRDVICFLMELADEPNLPITNEVRSVLTNISGALYEDIERYREQSGELKH